MAKHPDPQPRAAVPKLRGAAEELFDKQVDKEEYKRGAEKTARQLLRNIAEVLGIDEAKRIFAQIGAYPPKRSREEMNNHQLLWLYEHWGRPPKSTFARKVDELNKTLSIGSKIGARGGFNEAALRRQLTRLLTPKKRPKKRAK